MMIDGPIFHKPKSFIAAKNLLYASIFLSVIDFIIYNLRLSTRPNHLFLYWASAALGYAIMIIFIKQMALCKKWARNVLTILLIVVFISVVMSFFKIGYKMGILEVAIWALMTILQANAVIFLYGKECKKWFNSKKDEKQLG
jgi:hypothetical protein